MKAKKFFKTLLTWIKVSSVVTIPSAASIATVILGRRYVADKNDLLFPAMLVFLVVTIVYVFLQHCYEAVKYARANKVPFKQAWWEIVLESVLAEHSIGGIF